VSSDTNERPTESTAVPFVESAGRASIGLGVRGRYRIVGELGSGAFGTVYLAEEEATSHRVALRLLPRGLEGAPRAVEESASVPPSATAAAASTTARIVACLIVCLPFSSGFIIRDLCFTAVTDLLQIR